MCISDWDSVLCSSDLPLIFGLVFFAIGLCMFPKVYSTVDARDKRISADLEAAKAASARADEIEEEYRIQTGEDRAAAKKITQLAKDKAAKAAESRLAEADAKISVTITPAEAGIAEATESTKTEMERNQAKAAQDVMPKI